MNSTHLRTMPARVLLVDSSMKHIKYADANQRVFPTVSDPLV